MDKFIAFIKKHAKFLSSAVIVGMPLWFAVFGEHADAVVKLLEVVTAPAIIGGGVAVWFVAQFRGGNQFNSATNQETSRGN